MNERVPDGLEIVDRPAGFSVPDEVEIAEPFENRPNRVLGRVDPAGYFAGFERLVPTLEKI